MLPTRYTIWRMEGYPKSTLSKGIGFKIIDFVALSLKMFRAGCLIIDLNKKTRGLSIYINEFTG